ncbi:MAG: UTP--glucose-1-phosphate uridylyltransferase GalU [Sphingomonadales bacterium]
MFKKIKKAVFPVAGLGTRFLPATKSMPKEMLTVVDKPLLQYAVEEALSAGIEEIIFVTGRGKSPIEDHFDKSYELEKTLQEKGKLELLNKVKGILPSNVKVIYTRQGEALGLGHAVYCAHSIVGDEPFAVLLADDVFKCKTPCLKQMVNAYEKTGGNHVAIMEVPIADTAKYGVILPGSNDGKLVEVKGLVEKPKPEDAPSNLTISGRYILQPEIFKYLAEGRTGAGGEIQLTDAMAKLIGKQPFNGLLYEGERFDCGDKFGWLRANLTFALDRQSLKGPLTALMQDLLKK